MIKTEVHQVEETDADEFTIETAILDFIGVLAAATAAELRLGHTECVVEILKQGVLRLQAIVESIETGERPN